MLNDELIGAYLDGELDAEKRALVEHWLASDKGAARRLARMRSADDMVRLAVPRVATPEADPLAAMILAPEVSTQPKRQIWVRQAAALAAACVFGVLLGRATLSRDGDQSLWAMTPALSDVLDVLPSGQSTSIGDNQIEIALSLRSEAGDVCRQYRATSDNEAVDSLACRRDGAWRVVAQAADAPDSSEMYRTAGSATVIDAAIAQLGAVEALDASQEAAFVQGGWRARD